MRPIALATLAATAFATSLAGQAQPRPPAGGAVVVAAPGWGYGGARWVGGPYRPWYGPGYGYGYGRWGYGYPGYGFGLGYGAGWALAAAGSPWYWGAPSVAYVAPSLYPYGYVAPAYPAVTLHEDLTFVQRPPSQAAAEPVAPPAAAPAGYWYYCTEPAGYHPYVQHCSRPWIAVNPKSAAAGPAP